MTSTRRDLNTFSRLREDARQQVALELVSGGSGLVLALFMWGHVLLVGSILTGARGFDWLASTLERYYIAQPTVVIIFVIFLIHAAIASRKIPSQLRERRAILELTKNLSRVPGKSLSEPATGTPFEAHTESLLWIWQVRTGLVIIVLASFHLGLLGLDVLTPMFGEHRGIESATSMARVSGGLWLPYAILLLCAEFHASVGLYRLAIKWGAGRLLARPVLRAIEHFIFWLVLGLGVVTLLVLAGVVQPPLTALLPEVPQ